MFMIIPWQGYASGGLCGLRVLIRMFLVSAAKAAPMQAKQDAATFKVEEEDNE